MRFYKGQHAFYCGVDLHAKTMHVCLVNQAGDVLLHRNLPTRPDRFLSALAPDSKQDLIVACECLFSWYWLADLCADQKILFVLGHALYMKAVHGGKTKNDKIDSEKIAMLLRGGMLPEAYVYPHKMRATRDLLRRRMYLVNHRAEALAHVENTRTQYNRPAFEKRLCYAANRQEAAAHFDEPSVRRNVEVDLALIDHLDEQIRALELYLEKAAKLHDPRSFYLLRSTPGIGKILALTMLYEIHDVRRFSRVGRFLSYARLVKCPHESSGKRCGSGGARSATRISSGPSARPPALRNSPASARVPGWPCWSGWKPGPDWPGRPCAATPLPARAQLPGPGSGAGWRPRRGAVRCSAAEGCPGSAFARQCGRRGRQGLGRVLKH